MSTDNPTLQTVIREMQFFMQRIYTRDRKPIHESRLINFLKDRLPHEKILRAIEIAEREKLIQRGKGTTLYVPICDNYIPPLTKIVEALTAADNGYIRGAHLDDPARLFFYTTIEHYWGLIITTLQTVAKQQEPK